MPAALKTPLALHPGISSANAMFAEHG